MLIHISCFGRLQTDHCNVKITVKYFEGKTENLPYTAKMKYDLDNGASFTTEAHGVYDGISNTQFIEDSKTVAKWNEKKQRWDNI